MVFSLYITRTGPQKVFIILLIRLNFVLHLPPCRTFPQPSACHRKAMCQAWAWGFTFLYFYECISTKGVFLYLYKQRKSSGIMTRLCQEWMQYVFAIGGNVRAKNLNAALLLYHLNDLRRFAEMSALTFLRNILLLEARSPGHISGGLMELSMC